MFVSLLLLLLSAFVLRVRLEKTTHTRNENATVLVGAQSEESGVSDSLQIECAARGDAPASRGVNGRRARGGWAVGSEAAYKELEELLTKSESKMKDEM